MQPSESNCKGCEFFGHWFGPCGSRGAIVCQHPKAPKLGFIPEQVKTCPKTPADTPYPSAKSEIF